MSDACMDDGKLMRGFPPAAADQVTLANWREPPYSRWAFHHVREIVPSACIANDPAGICALPGAGDDTGLLDLQVMDEQGQACRLGKFQEDTYGDGLMVLHDGKAVLEWAAPHCPPQEPHIIFSVSKSLSAILAGVLVEGGEIDPELPVTHYVPEAAGSAYAGSTVRHVLDMTVGIEFSEDYLDKDGAFERYRRSTSWNPVSPGAPEIDLRSFLTTLPRDHREHGTQFHYVSPNSDMLGWIIERATGKRFSDLFSEMIWQPLGADHDGYVTVDRLGAPRSAGGICVTLADLARFGEMIRCNGFANGRQIAPESWIADIRGHGSYEAWQRGDMAYLFPKGRYRSKWYQTGNDTGAICAIGIHGQWIHIDPVRKVTIVATSSQPLPFHDPTVLARIHMFETIARSLG